MYRIYIYIYIERERDIDIHTYIHIYIYIYIYQIDKSLYPFNKPTHQPIISWGQGPSSRLRNHYNTIRKLFICLLFIV